jgi:predicted transcriptional regulator YdeE
VTEVQFPVKKRPFLTAIYHDKETKPMEPKIVNAYGVCGQVEPDGSFHYLAGIEVSQVDDQPEEMTHWTVPEQTYAAFPCTLQTIHETFRHAYQNWLPQSGYKQTDGPDLEFYPREFDAQTGTGMFVYVPISVNSSQYKVVSKRPTCG